MTIQQFGNALKAQITNEDRRHALGVTEGILNFFEAAHNYEEGQSSVIDELWNGGNLTRANLRNKVEAGEYEDWRRGGPIDDIEAGNLIGIIYNRGWNNVDFLVGESNDIQVINPLTGIVVSGFTNIIIMWDKESLLLLIAIRKDENFLQKQASLSSSASSKVISWDASEFKRAILATSSNESSSILQSDFTVTGGKTANMTPNDIRSFLDNEWGIDDIIFSDETGQLQATLDNQQLTSQGLYGKEQESETENQEYQQLENQIEQPSKKV